MARKSRKAPQSGVGVSPRTSQLPAWIYARISNSNEHTEPSIDNQINICKNYIDASSNLEFGGVFIDSGYSGTSCMRPGYSEMIAQVLSGSVKCIVVKDLSRLGRTYIDVGELLFDTFIQNGIRFVSVNEGYDTDTDDVSRKKLFILLKNLINHMYSLDLRKKIRATIELKKQRGEPLGLPPYGYCRSADKKRFEIDCEAAATVKLIFDRRLRGESAYCIAGYLNRQRVLTPQQYRNRLRKDSSKQLRWSGNTVARILHNVTYTGSVVQETLTIEDLHPAIVSKEQFEAVAQLMRESADKYRKKRDMLRDSRYLGKIFCSRCKKAAIRCESRKKDVLTFYYSCRNCTNELRDENSQTKVTKLPLSELDAIVEEALQNCMKIRLQYEDEIEKLSKSEVLKQKMILFERDKTELEKITSNCEHALLTAFTHYLSGLLVLSEYRLIRDKIESDKSDAEVKLAQVIKKKEKYDINNIRNNQWFTKFGEFRNFKAPTKELIQSLIRRIYMEPLTDDVEVEVNYMDSFEELREVMRETAVEM